MTEKDLQSWNSVQLTVTFNLKKLPGHEVPEKKTSLVESEIMDDGANDVNKGVNDFLMSRINDIFEEMAKEDQNPE